MLTGLEAILKVVGTPWALADLMEPLPVAIR